MVEQKVNSLKLAPQEPQPEESASMTKRETLDLGKSIYWNDEVKIRIEGVNKQKLDRGIGKQVRE